MAMREGLVWGGGEGRMGGEVLGYEDRAGAD